MGVGYVVVAPSLVPVRPAERAKTDRGNAVNLPTLLLSRKLTAGMTGPLVSGTRAHRSRVRPGIRVYLGGPARSEGCDDPRKSSGAAPECPVQCVVYRREMGSFVEFRYWV